MRETATGLLIVLVMALGARAAGSDAPAVADIPDRSVDDGDLLPFDSADLGGCYAASIQGISLPRQDKR